MLLKKIVVILARGILYISVGLLKGFRFTTGSEISMSGILPLTSVATK